MVWSYHYRLVVVSVVITTLGSYAALGLAGRVTSARGSDRAIVLGIAILTSAYHRLVRKPSAMRVMC